MGGLGGESIAESYADQRLGLTQAAEQERTLKPIRLMLMMRMTPRINRPMALGSVQAFQPLRELQRLFSIRGKQPLTPTTL